MNDLLYMTNVEAKKLAANVDRIRSARLRGKEPKQGWEDLFLSRKPMSIDANGIATIHVFGPLGKGIDPFWKILGSTDYDDFVAELREAEQNKAVRGLFLDHNSPGGTALGCIEASEALLALRGVKPTLSYSDQVCCSADYSIACGADAFWASASSMLGSIGTIYSWYEYSKMMEDVGLAPVVFQAGKLKNAGTDDRQPTAEEAAFFQATIDEMNDVFRSHVLAARGQVSDETMQGQWFSGRRAKELNLIDEVGSREEAYAELLYLVG
jgi:protease-4